MDTAAFFKKILPDTGVYFLATPNTAPKTGFRHHAYHDVRALAKGVVQLDSQGLTVYHACASYKHSYTTITESTGKVKKQYRTHGNVNQIKAFWFDIDCGEGKPYADQVEGFKALKGFLKESGLPKPSLVVLSGNGLHVYWTLTEAVIPNYWKPCASLLKDVAHLYGLETDNSRTSDQSSILRPPGSTHRKGEPKPVTVHLENPDVDYVPFLEAVAAAAKAKGFSPKPKKTIPILNAEYANTGVSAEPVYAEKIANGCQQIANMRDTRGVVPEPVWYDAIGVLRYCVEGDDLIHDWSSGHNGYSPEDTTRKIEQHRGGGFGPTTCAKFDGDQKGICPSCPKWGKITSPIVLGREIILAAPVEIQIDDETVTVIPPPFPYVRLKNGTIGIDAGDGDVVPFIPYDIVPLRRIYDVDAKQAIIGFRVTYPGDVPREFESLASSISGRDIGRLLVDKEIYLDEKMMKATQSYMMSYLREVQKLSASAKMYSQMGWKDELTKFVVGATIYNSDGTVTESKTMREKGATDWFSRKGDLSVWKAVAAAYEHKGLEAYQFGLLAGFAAPLMELSEYKGTLISLVSPRGGQGKTTIQEGIISIWGNPDKSILQASDKYLALMERMGKYCHLPVVIDELTNMPSEDLGAFAFQLTQGRPRIRLTSNATEKDNNTRWATLAITSSNASLVHKVSGLRTNSEAEALRIFEFNVINPGVIPKAEADELFHKWHDNYGVAGDVYARYIVTHVAEIKALMHSVQEKVRAMTDAQPNERFWINAIVLHIVAGSISNQLGLTDYNLKALLAWAVERLSDLRGTVIDNVSSNLSLISKFLMDNIGKRLVANHDGSNGKIPVISLAPQQSLVYRVETDIGLIIMPTQTIKAFLNSNGGDYNELKRELKELGALVETSSKRKLGAGSNIESVRTDCMVFNYDKAGIGKQASVVSLDEATGVLRSVK